MSAPDRLQRALGEEEPIASTRLGGEDALVVTPTRSILYRAGGVLSDESVAEFTHDAERITVEKSRRKATITLEYGLEGSDSFTVPKGTLEAVLKSLLAVNLSTTDVIAAEETVQAVFFFDELTLVITDAQVAKHVGAAVWDTEYESIPFGEVTGLAFESGQINTQVVLELGTTAERIKTPRERSRAVREALQSALCQFHGVDSVEALEETLAAAAPERESRDSVDAITLGEDFDLLSREDDPPSGSATYESESDTGEDTLDGLYDDRPADGADPQPEGPAEAASGAAPSASQSAHHGDADGDHDASSGQAPDTDGSSVARATRVVEPDTEGTTADGERDSGDEGPPAAEETRSSDGAGAVGASERSASDDGGAPDTTPDADEPAVDVEALAEQVEDLAAVVDRQAELLQEQRRAMEELLETLEDRGQ